LYERKELQNIIVLILYLRPTHTTEHGSIGVQFWRGQKRQKHPANREMFEIYVRMEKEPQNMWSRRMYFEAKTDNRT
jgi:hypothetical protein